MNINKFPPSKALYLQVRAGLIMRETTLAEWCRERGMNPTNARAALVGSWDGPKGKALRADLIDAARITEPTLKAV